MASASNTRARIQLLLAGEDEGERRAALLALQGFRIPLVADVLRLLLEWEPNTAIANEARPVLEAMVQHLAARKSPPPDRIAEAFRAPTSRYRTLGAIRSTAIGPMYLAVQVAFRRLVALTVAPGETLDAAARGRLERQLRSLAVVSHPGLPAVHDCGAQDGHVFVATELADGPVMQQLVDDHRALPPGEVMKLVEDIASALEALHAGGLIHGGVHATNVQADAHGRYRLTGFAYPGVLAKPRAPISPRPPEEPDAAPATVAGDLYALATVAWHALTASSPWSGDTPEALAKARQAGPPRLAAPTPEAEAIARLLESMLAPDPLERAARSANELVALIQKARRTLPARPSRPVPVPAVQVVETPTPPADGPHKTVLVVDDEDIILELLSQILMDAGYRVLTAPSPESALKLLKTTPVDVVLTDVMFPNGESGVDLVGALRREHPGINVVAMTGSRDAAIREELMGKGAAALMSKPLELSQILQVMERACKGGGRSLLLVDDDVLIRNLLSKMFTTEDYRVKAVGSVREATAALAEEVPDVVVCDLYLNHESGMDLLRAIGEKYPNLPVIMLTSSPDLESTSQAYRLRAFDYVMKSSDFSLLRRAVKQAVFFGVKSGRNNLLHSNH